jgi:hypothetical protein
MKDKNDNSSKDPVPLKMWPSTDLVSKLP